MQIVSKKDEIYRNVNNKVIIPMPITTTEKVSKNMNSRKKFIIIIFFYICNYER